jgi:hypothetical protein
MASETTSAELLDLVERARRGEVDEREIDKDIDAWLSMHMTDVSEARDAAKASSVSEQKLPVSRRIAKARVKYL